MIRRRLIAHGRVQGVFFRDGVRRRAAEHGVAGWVRNLPDGTVEAVFEGDAQAVEELVRTFRKGPGRASVDRTELFEEAPEDEVGFRIL